MHHVINLLIAHGHELAAEILRRIHLSHPGFRILGTASSAAELRKKISTDKPDVVLADLSLPGLRNIEELKKLATDEQIKMIILWWNQDKAVMNKAFDGHFDGYVQTKAPAADYKEAVQTVKLGGTYRCPETKKIAGLSPPIDTADPEFKKISGRSYQWVATCLKLGLSVKQIALSAGITYATAKTYKQHLKKFLGPLSEARLEEYLEAVKNYELKM